MPINNASFPMLTREQVSPVPYIREGMMFPQQLKQAQLENAIRQVQAQYAGPNAAAALKTAQQHNMYDPRIWQSEIGLRNQQGGYYGAEANKINQMTPLEVEEQRIKNKYLPEMQQAQTNMYNMGGRGNLSVEQKDIIALQNQLQIDHPEWDTNTANQAASSYLAGNDVLPDGTKLPSLSGISGSYIAAIQKRKSTAAIQNQASNMSVLSSDLNDIDIEPIKRFAGLGGRLDYATYAAKMAAGQPVPQEFRDYEAFKNVTSNFAMDALRKGFGTSVVPHYVYATLGKASNPASIWWHDPEQVQTDWDATKKWISSNAIKYKKLATQGVSASIDTPSKQPLDNSNAVSNNMKDNVTKVFTRDKNGKLVEVSS
jgi:hypothetical protein